MKRTWTFKKKELRRHVTVWQLEVLTILTFTAELGKGFNLWVGFQVSTTSLKIAGIWGFATSINSVIFVVFNACFHFESMKNYEYINLKYDV